MSGDFKTAGKIFVGIDFVLKIDLLNAFCSKMF